MTTKQQLAEQSHKSPDTVTKTLKAIGIDTSKSDYSQEECDRFFQARKKMDEDNYTYQQIEEEFGKPKFSAPLSSSSSTPQSEAEISQALAAQLAQLRQQFGQGVQEIARQSAVSAFSDLNVPLILLNTLQEHPEIHENIASQFRLLNEAFKTGLESSSNERQVFDLFNSLPSSSEEVDEDPDDDDDIWDVDGEEDDDDID